MTKNSDVKLKVFIIMVPKWCLLIVNFLYPIFLNAFWASNEIEIDRNYYFINYLQTCLRMLFMGQLQQGFNDSTPKAGSDGLKITFFINIYPCV